MLRSHSGTVLLHIHLHVLKGGQTQGDKACWRYKRVSPKGEVTEVQFSGWTAERQVKSSPTKHKIMQRESFFFSRSKLKMEDIKEVNKALKVSTSHGDFDRMYAFHVTPPFTTVILL